jgi:Leucine-rich repeat (LRR) protein
MKSKPISKSLALETIISTTFPGSESGSPTSENRNGFCQMHKSEGAVVLTEAMVSQKTRLGLNAVKKLNMWGLNLTDVSIISQMPNLEVLSLSVNHIQSLKPFASCVNLTEVFLRANQIADFAEVQYLAGLPASRSCGCPKTQLRPTHSTARESSKCSPHSKSSTRPMCPTPTIN